MITINVDDDSGIRLYQYALLQAADYLFECRHDCVFVSLCDNLFFCVRLCVFLCVTICFSVCDYVLCTSDLNEALYDILCNSIALFNFLSNVLH